MKQARQPNKRASMIVSTVTQIRGTGFFIDSKLASSCWIWMQDHSGTGFRLSNTEYGQDHHTDH